jgi:hypothetical protein
LATIADPSWLAFRSGRWAICSGWCRHGCRTARGAELALFVYLGAAAAGGGRGGCRQMQHAAAARATTDGMYSPGPRLLSPPNTASDRPASSIAALRGCAGAAGNAALARPHLTPRSWLPRLWPWGGAPAES